MAEILYDKLTLVYDKERSLGNTEVKEIVISLIPQSVSYSYTPNFQATSVLGRYTPIYSYKSGSDEVLSFTLDVHEDLIDTTKYKSLEEFVDIIKSLSYPRRDTQGALIFPRVYMQLGDIAGFGFVKTNITWKLPIREGKYVNASIDFNFTLEDRYTNPTLKKSDRKFTIEGLGSGEDLIYSDKIIDYRFEEHYNYIYKPEDYVTGGIHDTGVYDRIFERRDVTTDYRYSVFGQLQLEYAKLERLFGTFREVDSQAANRLVKMQEELSLGYKSLVDRDGFVRALGIVASSKNSVKYVGIDITQENDMYMTTINKSDYIKEVENFLDSYIEDNFYTRFNGSEEEADKFKKDMLTTTLDIYANIYELWRGAMTYGSSN